MAHSQTIDLHGMTVAEAKRAVSNLFDNLIRRGGRHKIRVVTGKGLHSGPSGGVLSGEIHQFVLERYRSDIVKITDSPSNVALDGIPLRGHFDVVIEHRRN